MTDLRKAAQQTLEALTNAIAVRNGEGGTKLVSPLEKNAITAIKAALAQPVQEPVAWRYRGNLHEFDPSDWAEGPVTPLYTTPPQRPWVGLEIEEVQDSYNSDYQAQTRAVEAKLKERNHD